MFSKTEFYNPKSVWIPTTPDESEEFMGRYLISQILREKNKDFLIDVLNVSERTIATGNPSDEEFRQLLHYYLKEIGEPKKEKIGYVKRIYIEMPRPIRGGFSC